MTLTHRERGFQGHRSFPSSIAQKSRQIYCTKRIFLPERDYVTFGSLLSQIRLSSVVCNVRAPSSWGWSFRQYLFAIWYDERCTRRPMSRSRERAMLTKRQPDLIPYLACNVCTNDTSDIITMQTQERVFSICNTPYIRVRLYACMRYRGKETQQSWPALCTRLSPGFTLTFHDSRLKSACEQPVTSTDSFC